MADALTVGSVTWRWQAEPDHWEVAPADYLTVAADPGTRWFVDPRDPHDVGMYAPALLAPVDGDVELRASVELRGRAPFDAGALVVYAHERAWAKLCLENSPQCVPTVVSVVTRGVSDDCNSFPLAPGRSRIALRLARVGSAYVFHASNDGNAWELIRYFDLGCPDPVSIGFQAQSPRGDGAEVHFADIRLIRQTVADIRSGE